MMIKRVVKERRLEIKKKDEILFAPPTPPPPPPKQTNKQTNKQTLLTTDTDVVDTIQIAPKSLVFLHVASQRIDHNRGEILSLRLF